VQPATPNFSKHGRHVHELLENGEDSILMFEIESRTKSVVQDHRVKTQSRTKTQSNETQTKAMIIWSSRGLKTTRSGFQLCRPQSIH